MTKEEYKNELVSQLLEKYGFLIIGEDLANLLGYPSLGAFRKSLQRGKVEVPILKLKNRRGNYALAQDVGSWLTESRFDSMKEIK